MTDSVKSSMGPAEWGMLVLLSALWGGSFFFTAVALRELPPLTVVMLRVVLAAVILLAALRALGLLMPTGHRVWTALFVMGLLNNAIPFCLFVWSQTHIASGLASILNATTPLSTLLIAHFLTSDEKLTGGGRLAGIAVGFLGVVVLVGPDALEGLGTTVWAQLAGLAASALYGFTAVYGRRFARLGLPPMATAAGQLAASS